MRKPTYLIIIVALAATVVAPPLSAFAQPGPDQQHLKPPQRAEPAPPPQASHHAFYYRPGDIKGVPYETIEGCWQAMQRAGNVGVCVMK